MSEMNRNGIIDQINKLYLMLKVALSEDLDNDETIQKISSALELTAYWVRKIKVNSINTIHSYDDLINLIDAAGNVGYIDLEEENEDEDKSVLEKLNEFVTLLGEAITRCIEFNKPKEDDNPFSIKEMKAMKNRLGRLR